MSASYEKILTANDIGATGGHQAGIVVPKNKALLKFFPQLDTQAFNPDAWITCIDEDDVAWKMRYVYYNGRAFTPPKSTRNEYRMTHMTKFLSRWAARIGDAVVFSSTEKENTYTIKIRRIGTEDLAPQNAPNAIVVLKGWRAVF